jgi:hypothetical protein
MKLPGTVPSWVTGGVLVFLAGFGALTVFSAVAPGLLAVDAGRSRTPDGHNVALMGAVGALVATVVTAGAVVVRRRRRPAG